MASTPVNRDNERLIGELEKNLKGDDRHFWYRWSTAGRRFLGRLIYRSWELTLALLVSLLLSLPVALILFGRRLWTGKSITCRLVLAGQMTDASPLYLFACSQPFVARLALYPQVLLGRVALVGRTAVSPDSDGQGPSAAYWQAVKPGVVSLWAIRSGAGIGHEGRSATEWEYRFTRTLLGDLAIFLRGIPALFYRGTAALHPDYLELFGIRVANLSMSAAVASIEAAAVAKNGSQSVFFVNPDCLNKTFSDREYATILQQGDHVLPDGIGLTVAGKMLGTPLKENVNGTDLLPYLCRSLGEKGLSIFLLGGRPGVAERAAERISEQFGVKVAGTHHGYFDHQGGSRAVLDRLNASGAAVVLVAFGAPLQEKWIAANLGEVKAGAVLGVGGLFDFYSGNIKRAPRWLREIGLEWLFRIMQEPGRMWRRYVVGNPLFLFRVLKWKRQINKSKGSK